MNLPGFNLRILTPDKIIIDQPVKNVIVRTIEGDIGILKNHILTHNKQKVIKRIRRKYICAHCNNKFPSGKKLKLHMQLHIEKEEISTEVSSSSINIDEECYHINSICEEMFNMLKNDIVKKEFCCDILTETESCDDLVL